MYSANSSASALYQAYSEKMQRIADIRYATAVLQWDQETYLPVKGADARGRQIATLSELAHQYFTEDALGQLLQELLHKEELSATQKKNIELTLYDYEKNKKYSPAFVRLMAEQTNKTFHAWVEARKQNRFAVFEKDLDALVQLKKQEADLLGYTVHPYDALLNEFERGCTVTLLDKNFSSLLPGLKKLLERIQAAPQVNDDFLHQHFPKQAQWEWGVQLLKQLHFDFDAGRQDISEHPFTINFASSDVRITTRIDEQDFSNMTWSCIHELGHALYEQGIPASQYGLPSGEYASLSIHESQSRLWENNVGRSLAFWEYYYPQLTAHFPGQLQGIDVKTFYKGINKIHPGLIRTEADELTYHFHVYIRYELEKKLIAGELAVKDIPAYWNEEYKRLLNVTVADDKSGCLQDVHWGHGSFGYFSTYSLGSLYAAQFFHAWEKEQAAAITGLQKGNTLPLLNWLRANVHQYGRQFTSEELCRKITGEALNSDYFMQHLLQKYSLIYTL